ncbi:hypothetical protein A5773_20085 [Mycobacterium sp. 852014-52450_SCH5900713]|uniref:terminase large subunit domain-containing protein n=1 Tax=Mycobacterium sp. 852014-52450_SCH5900713 TaxID=1834116 RepID=UPI0008011516|nr:terminase family protein [Mycobacterium sp. 852014-52450_SCH5900713]OBF93049.1 hypothetical protein A5773_20085 [Mycobacterium sp. 852014-52450_SCH5900713]
MFADTETAARALAEAEHLAQRRARRVPTTPHHLGHRVLPNYRVTPSVALIGQEVDRAIRQRDDRLIITVPPRESKSTTSAVLGSLLALTRNPDTRIILASYADELAETHSREVRRLISDHGDQLGLALSSDKSSAGQWTIDGRRGGLLASGILSGITGHGTDGLLIVDDAVKNMADADSPTLRRRVVEEFRATLMSRVEPGASVVVIGTRWHPSDLIGTLLREEGDRWRLVAIPAVAAVGVPDSLGRAPGEALLSAVGRTAADFDERRRSLGERAWWAEFMGLPASPEGNVIRADWLDAWRLSAMPSNLLRTVVGVDPSDSGRGDAAGIVAASLTAEGTVVIHRDISAPMTPEAWASAAVQLALDVDASEIAVEAFTAREGYLSVVRNALARHPAAHIMVTAWPPKGQGNKGNALARSSKLVQGLETGTVRLVGVLPGWETAATGWQGGDHQADCVAATVVAHDVLSRGGGVYIADPIAAQRRALTSEPPAWLTRSLSDRPSGGNFNALLGRDADGTPYY